MEDTTMEKEKVFCAQCGKECVSDGCGTGYGENSKGEKICYDCCGVNDKKELDNLPIGERMTFYLTKGGIAGTSYKWHISNWPGTLKIGVFVSEGDHNIARVQRSVEFSMPLVDRNNKVIGYKMFYGRQYGEDSEVCRIKRGKDKAK